MKNEMKVPTMTELCQLGAREKSLRETDVFKKLPKRQRKYWRDILTVCLLNDKLPTVRTFSKWIATNYFPYEYTRSTAIRRLLAYHGLTYNIRFYVPEVDFPFPKCLHKITDRQLKWLSKNSTYGNTTGGQ